MNGKNELEYMKKQKVYSVIALILGLFYSYTLTDDRLGSGFLLSTLVYFIAYLYFLKNSLDKLSYEVRLNPAIPMALTFFIILSGIAIVYFRVLEKFNFIAEEAYPIMIFTGFLIFEAMQHDKYKNITKDETPIEPVNLEKDSEPVKKSFSIGKKK